MTGWKFFLVQLTLKAIFLKKEKKNSCSLTNDVSFVSGYPDGCWNLSMESTFRNLGKGRTLTEPLLHMNC